MSSTLRLLIATRNRGKVAEFRRLLSRLSLEVVGPEDIEAQVPGCVEGGSSFCDNARLKATHWHAFSGEITLADDSGLAVEALDGAPGVRSARFAGPNATDAENLALLLRLLEGVKPSRRGASFICCLALCWGETAQSLVTFQGSCAGVIVEKPLGSSGFGYDPVFYYPPLGKTFAQLTFEEKNRVSHRGRAVEALRKWLESRNCRFFSEGN